MDTTTGIIDKESTAGAQGRVIVGIIRSMVPSLLAILPFAFGLFGLGLGIVVGGNFIIIVSRLYRHKFVSGLDISFFILGVFLAIGYFGFGNIFFIQHFGVVIYSALLIQVIYGELRGQPFTAQYSKQMYSSDRWGTRAFFEANRFISRLWGVISIISILLAAFGTNGLELIVIPNVLLVLALVFGPSIGRWYGIRFLQKASPQLDARR